MSKETLEDLLERLQTTKSIEELQVWTHEFRDFLGVTHVLYHTANVKGEQVGAFTYPIEWMRRYVEKDYKSVDPIVLGAMRRFHPMDWKSCDWSSPAARRFLKEAVEAGVGNQGWAVPIWGPSGEFALFSINHQADDTTWEDFVRRKAKDILLTAHLVHQQTMRIVHNEVDPPSAELSPREREALAQLSVGSSRASVADSLNISENTLRAYIDSARHKLGAANVTHAVALALAKGIILPTGSLPKY